MPAPRSAQRRAGGRTREKRRDAVDYQLTTEAAVVFAVVVDHTHVLEGDRMPGFPAVAALGTRSHATTPAAPDTHQEIQLTLPLLVECCRAHPPRSDRVPPGLPAAAMLGRCRALMPAYTWLANAASRPPSACSCSPYSTAEAGPSPEGDRRKVGQAHVHLQHASTLTRRPPPARRGCALPGGLAWAPGDGDRAAAHAPAALALCSW
jgi:hypothetical protein